MLLNAVKANIEKRLCMFQGGRFATGPLLVWVAWSCVQRDQTCRGFRIVSARIWHMVVPDHSVLMPVCCVSILALERRLDCVATICLSVSPDPLKGIIDGHKLHVTLLRWVIRVLLVLCFLTQVVTSAGVQVLFSSRHVHVLFFVHPLPLVFISQPTPSQMWRHCGSHFDLSSGSGEDETAVFFNHSLHLWSPAQHCEWS